MTNIQFQIFCYDLLDFTLIFVFDTVVKLGEGGARQYCFLGCMCAQNGEYA